MAADRPAAPTVRRPRLRAGLVDISEFEKLEGCVTCLSVRSGNRGTAVTHGRSGWRVVDAACHQDRARSVMRDGHDNTAPSRRRRVRSARASSWRARETAAPWRKRRALQPDLRRATCPSSRSSPGRRGRVRISAAKSTRVRRPRSPCRCRRRFVARRPRPARSQARGRAKVGGDGKDRVGGSRAVETDDELLEVGRSTVGDRRSDQDNRGLDAPKHLLGDAAEEHVAPALLGHASSCTPSGSGSLSAIIVIAVWAARSSNAATPADAIPASSAVLLRYASGSTTPPDRDMTSTSAASA